MRSCAPTGRAGCGPRHPRRRSRRCPRPRRPCQPVGAATSKVHTPPMRRLTPAQVHAGARQSSSSGPSSPPPPPPKYSSPAARRRTREGGGQHKCTRRGVDGAARCRARRHTQRVKSAHRTVSEFLGLRRAPGCARGREGGSALKSSMSWPVIIVFTVNWLVCLNTSSSCSSVSPSCCWFPAPSAPAPPSAPGCAARATAPRPPRLSRAAGSRALAPPLWRPNNHNPPRSAPFSPGSPRVRALHHARPAPQPAAHARAVRGRQPPVPRAGGAPPLFGPPPLPLTRRQREAPESGCGRARGLRRSTRSRATCGRWRASSRPRGCRSRSRRR